MTISIGSYQDLEPDQGQPIDRNPSMPCQECGESYKWQDYWKERTSGPDSTFRCDDCYGVLIEQARIDRRKERNAKLGDFE